MEGGAWWEMGEEGEKESGSGMTGEDRRETQRARRINGNMQLWGMWGGREPLESPRTLEYDRFAGPNGDYLSQNIQKWEDGT